MPATNVKNTSPLSVPQVGAQSAGAAPLSSATVYSNVVVAIYLYYNADVWTKNVTINNNGAVIDPPLLPNDNLLTPDQVAAGEHLVIASLTIPQVIGGLELNIEITGYPPAPGTSNQGAGQAWVYVKINTTWSPTIVALSCDSSQQATSDQTYAITT
jgi:hypothetical protein